MVFGRLSRPPSQPLSPDPIYIGGIWFKLSVTVVGNDHTMDILILATTINVARKTKRNEISNNKRRMSENKTKKRRKKKKNYPKFIQINGIQLILPASNWQSSCLVSRQSASMLMLWTTTMTMWTIGTVAVNPMDLLLLSIRQFLCRSLAIFSYCTNGFLQTKQRK